MRTWLLFVALASEPEKWTGVDESVVAKFAQSAGRPPAPSMFDGLGDLPLLMFLMAGLIGGFALGYFYRILFVDAPTKGRGDDNAL